jgi:hypothetical protein
MVAQQLLQPVGTITLPGVPRFVASEKFIVNSSFLAKTKIVTFGEQFAQRFLNKIEEPVPDVTLAYSELTYDSDKTKVFAPDIAGEIGEREDVCLAHIFSLIEQQGRGGYGLLLSNGLANFFKATDTCGISAIVTVGWGYSRDAQRGWCVEARNANTNIYYSFLQPGTRVFARAT